MINKRVAKKIEMIVSSIPGKIFFNNKFFVIQQKAAAKKIKLTAFCS